MRLRLTVAALLLTALSAAQDSKIDPRLRQSAVSDSVHALVTLRDQPQADTLRRAEGGSLLRRVGVESELDRLRNLGAAADNDFLKAKARLDEITVATRQTAAAEVWSRIRPQQDGVESRIRALGGTVLLRYWSINMLAVELPARALDALEGDPEIARVDREEMRQAHLDASVPAFGAPAMWAAGYTGRGEAVGILDTGIYRGHPGFSNVNVVPKVFLDGGRRAFCFADDPNSTEDLVEHGTHVSGIVAMQGFSGYANFFGVARGLGILYSLKTGFLTKASQQGNCQAGGSFSSFDYFAAIDWALANTAIGVFNASFGGTAEGDDDTDTRRFDYYVDTFGVSFAISAGNSGPAATTLGTPGIAYNVITVASINTNRTATRSDDVLSTFSSRGPTLGNRAKPDIAAPGQVIYSAAYNSSGLLGLSGTSMAAPHVAGAVALIRSSGVKDPRAIKAILINSADGAGWSAGVGWGYANLGTLMGQRNAMVDTIGSRQLKFYKSISTGFFKATIAWNRHAFANNQLTPVFNDLGIKLYTGGDNTEVATSTYHGQNVQQVWWTKNGPMVIKVLAGTLSGDSEDYGIAFSNSVTQLNGPSLSFSCTGPTAAVSSGSTFSISCTASNDGDMDAFGVNGSLSLPSGFGGGGTQFFGTLAAGTSATRVFTATAGTSSAAIQANLSAATYGENFTATAPSVSVSVGTSTLPALSVNPATLSFNYTSGGGTPSSQSVIVGLSKGTAAATVTVSASWLTARLAAAAAPTTLSVSVAPSSLGAGTYTGTVQVAAAGATTSPATITVTLRVAAASTAVKAESQRMARTVDFRNGCPIPDAVSKFYTTDGQARLWFILRGAKQDESGTAEWIAPNGTTYQTGGLGTIASSGDYCFSPGVDIGNLPASVQTGNWQVRVSWMGVQQFTLSFSIARPVTLVAAVTTDSAPDSVCTVPNGRSNFFVTDSRVYVWFSVRDYQQGDIAGVQFLKPDGGLYYTGTWNPAPNDRLTRCYWSWIDVAGTDAANSQGTWKVNGTWNGIQYFSFDFTIAPPVNVERKLMTSDSIDSLSCTIPSATKTFLRTDPTAAIWFSVNGANAGDVARVEYIAPDGSLWSNLSWDPLDSSGNWCLWAWLNVASNSRVQAQVGKWKVNGYWNETPIFNTDFTIAPVIVSGQMLTKATLSNICSTPVPETNFLTTDARARAWFTVDDAATGDVASLEWWAPDGTRYLGASFAALDSGGSWCFGSSLPIMGQAAAAKTGVWSNRVFWNGIELYRLAFRIDKPAGGTETLSVTPMALNGDSGEPSAETEMLRSGEGKPVALPVRAPEPQEAEPAQCGGSSNGGRAGKVGCQVVVPSGSQKLQPNAKEPKVRAGFGAGAGR